jgi:hypothetical protein
LQWLEKALLRHLLFADSLRKQAFSQACAIRSPFLVSMSEIEILRQPSI